MPNKDKLKTLKPLPLKNNFRCPLLFFWNLGIFFIFLFSFSVAAYSDAQLDRRFIEIQQRSESFQLHQNDPLKILSRLSQAQIEAKQGHFVLAEKLLESCSFDLDLLESERAVEKPSNAWKQARLEMLFDLLRWYILTAILAVLIIKLPWFHQHRETKLAHWGAAFLLTTTAIIFGWADIINYGQAAWSYFNIQVVLTACAALFGGWLPALLMGLCLTGLRLLIQPDLQNSSLVLLGSVFLGGLFHFKIKNSEKKLFLIGVSAMLVGALHGFALYIALKQSLPAEYLLLIIAFVASSEALGIFLFFVVIESLLREEKQEAVKHELVRSQLMFLQAQIKPHFLFNALNTISAVCSAEKAPKSRHLIGHLADFFRHALETEDHVLSLEKELLFVDAYLELEKARFGDEIQIVKNVTLSPLARNLRIPILVIQPVVENAIRHGLRKKSAPGTLRIETEEKENQIEIRIHDDGVGNTPDFFENYLNKNIGKAEGHGIGVRNINERLRRFFGKGEWLRFETALGKGTLAIISIPKSKPK